MIAAIGVCLSIIFSGTQVCKRSATSLMGSVLFKNRLKASKCHTKEVVDSHTMFRSMNVYIQCKNHLIFLFSIQFGTLDVFGWWMTQNSIGQQNCQSLKAWCHQGTGPCETTVVS